MTCDGDATTPQRDRPPSRPPSILFAYKNPRGARPRSPSDPSLPALRNLRFAACILKLMHKFRLLSTQPYSFPPISFGYPFGERGRFLAISRDTPRLEYPCTIKGLYELPPEGGFSIIPPYTPTINTRPYWKNTTCVKTTNTSLGSSLKYASLLPPAPLSYYLCRLASHER